MQRNTAMNNVDGHSQAVFSVCHHFSEACKLSDLIDSSHLAGSTQMYYASENPIEFTCAANRLVVVATELNKFTVSCTGAAWGETAPANAQCQGISF